jgi:hypothetical protein
MVLMMAARLRKTLVETGSDDSVPLLPNPDIILSRPSFTFHPAEKSGQETS